MLRLTCRRFAPTIPAARASNAWCATAIRPANVAILAPNRHFASDVAASDASPPAPATARESHATALQQTGWRQTALRLSGYYSEQSSQIRAAKIMYEACAEHADGPELRAACQLEDSFATRFNLTVLHAWICLVRLRDEGEWGETVSQILYDQWLEDMEQKLVLQDYGWLEISNFTKDFQRNFFNACQSYDEGLAGDDGLLVRATPAQRCPGCAFVALR